MDEPGLVSLIGILCIRAMFLVHDEVQVGGRALAFLLIVLPPFLFFDNHAINE